MLPNSNNNININNDIIIGYYKGYCYLLIKLTNAQGSKCKSRIRYDFHATFGTWSALNR